MADESISRSPTNHKGQLTSLLGGFLIAGLCFALLLELLAYLIPVFFRIVESPWSRLLAPLAIISISVSGLVRCLRGRAKRAQTRAFTGLSQ
jgi:hypothetical protein